VAEKIGVYVCECGPNIKEALDLADLVTHTGDLPMVTRVQQVNLICSPEGQSAVAADIRGYGLTRVVFAGCSPKEHQQTFSKIMAAAGLNPFLMQVANIREQCAWVVGDPRRATRKARDLVRGAVKRVVHHEPLEISEIDCCPDVLVIGAGLAGISAARSLAQENRKVYLVEKQPCIGGKVALFEDLFPDNVCAACVLEYELDAVIHNPDIELITLGEVTELTGYFGNFTAGVKKKARFVDETACIGCGACLAECPVELPNEYNEGLDSRRAVYMPYPGALPSLAVIDSAACLRFQGESCSACRDSCPFGAIDYGAVDESLEVHVGAVVVATGLDVFDPAKATREGGPTAENVITGLAFERMVNSAGPTGGDLVLKNGDPPRQVAIIHCVGSRTEQLHGYCSGICCQYALKHAHQIRRKLPGATITAIHTDMCLPGLAAQRFFNRVSREDRITFVQAAMPREMKITRKGSRRIIICRDVRGEIKEIPADLIILETAAVNARGTRELGEVLGIARDRDGFFETGQGILSPLATSRQGIYIAGCAQGPKDVPASAAQGQAAAGRILKELVPGKKLTLEPMLAWVNDETCSGCAICLGICPFKAISDVAEETAISINPALCRGCGICAAACPSGAIYARHFTAQGIKSEIEGLLKA